MPKGAAARAEAGRDGGGERPTDQHVQRGAPQDGAHRRREPPGAVARRRLALPHPPCALAKALRGLGHAAGLAERLRRQQERVPGEECRLLPRRRRAAAAAAAPRASAPRRDLRTKLQRRGRGALPGARARVGVRGVPRERRPEEEAGRVEPDLVWGLGFRACRAGRLRPSRRARGAREAAGRDRVVEHVGELVGGAASEEGEIHEPQRRGRGVVVQRARQDVETHILRPRPARRQAR